MARDPADNVYWFPPGGVVSLFMNLTETPFSNVDFRKGVSYAIDRQAVENKAVFGVEVELEDIPGAPPDLSLEELGCAFAPRCPVAASVCSEVTPRLEPLGDGKVTCHVRAPSLLVGGPRSAS